MTEYDAIAELLREEALIDTFLNILTLAFIAIVVWLYVAAPTHLDD